jgi:hypothetical protein
MEKKKKKKKISDFATTNLQLQHRPGQGDCNTCKRKDVAICEHGHCMICLCKHYCWLD